MTVSHAFHSPQVEPILAELERVASAIRYAEPQVRTVSTVTGNVLSAGEIPGAAYWRKQARQPVRFAQALQSLRGQGCRLFVEVGPGVVLSALGRQTVGDGAEVWLPSLRQGRDSWRQLLESLGRLYTAGVRVNWAALDGDSARRRLPLPTYPFQRQRYWLPNAAGPVAPVPVRSALPPPSANGVHRDGPPAPSSADQQFVRRLHAAAPESSAWTCSFRICSARLPRCCGWRSRRRYGAASPRWAWTR